MPAVAVLPSVSNSAKQRRIYSSVPKQTAGVAGIALICWFFMGGFPFDSGNKYRYPSRTGTSPIFQNSNGEPTPKPSHAVVAGMAGW